MNLSWILSYVVDIVISNGKFCAEKTSNVNSIYVYVFVHIYVVNRPIYCSFIRIKIYINCISQLIYHHLVIISPLNQLFKCSNSIYLSHHKHSFTHMHTQMYVLWEIMRPYNVPTNLFIVLFLLLPNTKYKST